MRYLHTIFIVLFFILGIFFSLGINQTFANGYITQVNVDSSKEKVKKLQEVFKGLGLYNGEIDGDFYSIRESLIKYQVENGIVPSADHAEAGYFGNKTIRSLRNKFGQDFVDLQKSYLKLEAPELNQEGHFIVTAYYSPLPGQIKYTTGSYESEIRLNGGGNTASGKKPSAGTIAAPRNYAFGTKISLEGFGVGVVEDRGGAILNSGDKGFLHDRLDVWMGYGDEGRLRTQAWGRKTIKGTIIDSSSPTKVFFEEEVPVVISQNTTNQVSSSFNIDNIFISPDEPNIENVKKIQELFKKIKFYDGEIDGNYSKIKDILIDFQLKNGIIDSKNSFEAGYFGKKTIDALKNNFGQDFDKNISEQQIEKKEDIISEQKNNIEEKEYLLTQEKKDKIQKVRDNFYSKLSLKNSGDKDSIDKEISQIKATMIKVLEKYSGRKKDILSYFTEIL